MPSSESIVIVSSICSADLVLRQRGVQLIPSDIAALLAARDHLLDGRGNRIEQRAFRRLFTRLACFRCRRRFCRHPASTLYANGPFTPMGLSANAP